METKTAKKNQFKKGVDIDESRRNRSQTSLQIRKDKKEEQIDKLRKRDTPVASDSIANPPLTSASAAQIEEHRRNIFSDDPTLILKSTQQLRRFLSIEKNPPIQQVIQAGVIPRLVAFLQMNDNPSLQFEAAWALTNIASGTSEHTLFVLDAGAVPIFIQLLLSPNEDVREQAAWALGNVAGDSVQCRDYVLGMNALPILLQTFTDQSRLSTIRNATWTLSNLCRGKPAPHFEVLRPALPILSRLVYSQDIETVTDACWALSYISDGPNDRIQAVLNAGVAPRLVELLAHSQSSVQTPALRAVGNIVTGDDSQTQFIVSLNAIVGLLGLLDHAKKNIRKEACWTISNITAGTPEQIQAVINTGVIPKLIELMQGAEFDIQKESAWAISNATSGGTPEQILYLAQCGAIQPLCDMLSVSDSKIITVALEGLQNIFRVAKEAGDQVLEHLVAITTQCGGVAAIEELQNHENQLLYQRAVLVLETYFGGEDQESSEIAPALDNSSQQYQFNTGNNNSGGNFQF